MIQIDGAEVFMFDVPSYSMYRTPLQSIIYDGGETDNSVIIGADVTELVTGSLFSTLCCVVMLKQGRI